MDRDKFPSLKPKHYLFSPANAEQRWYKQQLTVKETKGGSSSGPPTYASNLTTKIKPYGGNIEPAKFCKRLDQAKQYFKHKFDEEDE